MKRRTPLVVALALALAAAMVGCAGSDGTEDSRSSTRSGPLAELGWKLTDLGTLGGRYSSALTIDDQGTVMGTSRTASEARYAFVWKAGTMTRLAQLRHEASWFDLAYESFEVPKTGRGPMVVYLQTGVYLWKDGRLRKIARGGTIYAMNDRGQLIGAGGGYRAFLWQDGKTTDLGELNLDGFQMIAPQAINERGQIVGVQPGESRQDDRAVLWEQGKLTPLAIPGLPIGPLMINDAGQIVVNATVGERAKAFLWEEGKLTDLGELDARRPHRWASPGTTAKMINEHGQVVGSSNGRAFVWESGVLTDLGPGAALAVNTRGQVVGFHETGEPGDDTYRAPPFHAALWTPQTSQGAG